MAHIYGHDNLLPQQEIQLLVIEFLNLGLGRVVQCALRSSYESLVNTVWLLRFNISVFSNLLIFRHFFAHKFTKLFRAHRGCSNAFCFIGSFHFRALHC